MQQKHDLDISVRFKDVLLMKDIDTENIEVYPNVKEISSRSENYLKIIFK